MARQLNTPQGTVDLTNPDAAQPELLAIIAKLSGQLADARQQRQAHAQESGRHRRRADALQERLNELEQADVAELRKELRAQKRIAGRRNKRVEQLVAERRELAAIPKNLNDRIRDLTRSNDKFRTQISALKIDLDRARAGDKRDAGPILTDLQIAALLLTELNDRLIGEARRTTSTQAGTALRLAAREVTKTRQQLSQRGHLEVAS